MKESINLWELITEATADKSKLLSERQELKGLKKLLEKSSRYRGQELSLKPTPEGWEIEIFSCYDTGDGPSEKIKIVVPKSGVRCRLIVENT